MMPRSVTLWVVYLLAAALVLLTPIVTPTVTVAQQLPPVAVDVSESVGVSDSPQALPPVTIDLAESIGVSDSPQALPPVAVDVAETVGVSDLSSSFPAGGRRRGGVHRG